MVLLQIELFDLLRAYCALVPPNNISFPSHLPKPIIQNFLINLILLNPLFQTYPPSKQYQFSFWKWAIHQLEETFSSEDDEIDAQIFDYFVSILPPSTFVHLHLQPPSPSYVTHFWKPATIGSTSQPVGMLESTEYQATTLLESRAMIESGTTGLRTWLASLILSQYLIMHPELVKDKHILELGSGTGFLGIVVATLQQLSASATTNSVAAGNSFSLWTTDIDQSVLSRCRDNLQLSCNLSSLHPNVNYRILDWSASLEPEISPSLKALLHDEIKAELILGADIVFDPSLIPALIGVLCLALQCDYRDSQKAALIAFPVRNEHTLGKFLDIAQEKSLMVEDLQVRFKEVMFHEVVGGDASTCVKIFKITRKDKRDG